MAMNLDALRKMLSTKENVEIIDINEQYNHCLGTANNRGNIVLYFKGLTDVSDFQYTRSGRTLMINYGDRLRQRVYIKNYFADDKGTTTKSMVKYVRYDNPNSTSSKDKTIDVSIIDSGAYHTEGIEYTYNKKGVVSGATVFSDTINMYDSLDEAIGKNNKGLTINAGKGNDSITGSKFNDTITGGVGANTYNFDFGVVSGADTIKLTKGETLTLNITNAGSQIALNELSYKKSGNDLYIYQIVGADKTESDNKLIIKNYFKNTDKVSIGDVKLIDFISSAEYPVLNIIGKGKIKGTDYNDNITGSLKNDTITAGKGDDFISTAGGKDTVVLTGEYGHDIIDSIGSSKVTLKLSSFDSKNYSYDSNNLTYTTDEKSSFQYNDFMSADKDTADLWISAKNKSYHIINEKSNLETDYSTNKNNNVIFLSAGDNQKYTGAKNQKGINVIYSVNGNNSYVYQGGKDTYVDYGTTSDNYSATINKNTKLVIDDKGGVDSLVLNNKVDDLALFFDTDSDSFGEDLYIYNAKTMTYSNLTNAIKSNSYKGSIEIDDYFSDGKIENIKYGETSFDMDGWTLYAKTEVSDWLNSLENVKLHKSVKDVFLTGTKAEKVSLTNLFKALNYSEYQKLYNSAVKYSDYKFVKEGNDLKIFISGDLNTSYENYFTADDYDSISFYALNNEGNFGLYEMGSKENPIHVVATSETIDGTKYHDVIETKGETNINLYESDDEVVFLKDYTSDKVVTTANGSKDTFVFEDKEYTDFYTKGTLSGAYSAGDPLIIKDGNDLKIGDITVKNVDGMPNEIQLVDKNGKTKNIIIGQGTINGTHESEIIIGSNSADVINTNGRNDLVYMGEGKDILNLTSTTGDETGKNTAEMIGIGGTHSISNDLDVPAISVYSASGDDTYNTTLKDFGLYIEDYAGTDTLNITYSDNNLMYLFDVVNPKHASENPTIYTDLMICDKSQFTSAGMGAFSSLSGSGMKAIMESMQGTFGYAWIDDYYGGAQKIENINIINETDGTTSALDIDTEIASTQAKIAAWLSSTSGFFKPSQDYATAWDVIEGSSTSDKMYLAMLYMS